MSNTLFIWGLLATFGAVALHYLALPAYGDERFRTEWQRIALTGSSHLTAVGIVSLFASLGLAALGY